jgi:hypothetical protein
MPDEQAFFHNHIHFCHAAMRSVSTGRAEKKPLTKINLIVVIIIKAGNDD